MEAEVIVHSELSELQGEREKEQEEKKKLENSEKDRCPHTNSSQPSTPDDSYFHVIRPSLHGEKGAAEKPPQAQTPPAMSAGDDGGDVEDSRAPEESSANTEAHHDTGLTNGFHSPKTLPSVLRSEHLENGDSRHRPSAPGKSVSVVLSPAPFVSSGFVNSTSTAHSYLCP